MARITLMALALLTAPRYASAQGWRGAEDRPLRERPEGARGWREAQDPEGRGTSHSHVEQWLEHLLEADPAEFHRLKELREADPAAFRVELRRRLHEARVMKRIEEDHPGFHEYLTGLSHEERDRLGRFLRDLATEGEPGGFRHRRLPQPGWSREAHVQALISQWHASGDDPERRAEIETALRAQVEQVFDQRTEEQEQAVREARRQLERLNRILEQRQDQRTTWVARIVADLLEGKREVAREASPDAGDEEDD